MMIITCDVCGDSVTIENVGRFRLETGSPWKPTIIRASADDLCPRCVKTIRAAMDAEVARLAPPNPAEDLP